MTQGEAANFVATFLLELGESIEVEVVIVPPFTAIAAINTALGSAQQVKVGAQNMHWERSGAFTGEISPAMWRDLFKVRSAHEAMLRPIVCVGDVEKVLATQNWSSARDVTDTGWPGTRCRPNRRPFFKSGWPRESRRRSKESSIPPRTRASGRP